MEVDLARRQGNAILPQISSRDVSAAARWQTAGARRAEASGIKTTDILVDRLAKRPYNRVIVRYIGAKQMSKLLITTQVYENYAWQEDGSIGTGDQAYWKAKGGGDYVVKNFQGDATQAVMILRDRVEQDNDYFREQIIDWKIVADDYMTEFEQSQMAWEGRVQYPAQELTFS